MYAEDGNEAGKGTGFRSLEGYLEELRLFGLEKMQGNLGSVLRTLKVSESRQGLDGHREKSKGPGVEVTERRSSAQQKIKLLDIL